MTKKIPSRMYRNLYFRICCRQDDELFSDPDDSKTLSDIGSALANTGDDVFVVEFSCCCADSSTKNALTNGLALRVVVLNSLRKKRNNVRKNKSESVVSSTKSRPQ